MKPILLIPLIDSEELTTELVTNGTFDTDYTGWTINRASVANVVSGEMVRRGHRGDCHHHRVLASRCRWRPLAISDLVLHT